MLFLPQAQVFRVHLLNYIKWKDTVYHQKKKFAKQFCVSHDERWILCINRAANMRMWKTVYYIWLLLLVVREIALARVVHGHVNHTLCVFVWQRIICFIALFHWFANFFLFIIWFVVVFVCLSFRRRFHPARNSCWTRPVASNASIRSIVIIVKLGKRRWARRRGARQCPIYHRNRWDQHRLLSHLQCRSQLHLHRRLHRHSEELMSARDCSKSQLSSKGKNLHDCFVIDLICCVFSVIWTRTWLANVTCTSFWTEIF